MALGRGRDQAAHLVESPGSDPCGPGPRDAESTRMDSTFPGRLVLASPQASPERAARAAEMASWGRTCPCAGGAGGWGGRLRRRGPVRPGGDGSARLHREPVPSTPTSSTGAEVARASPAASCIRSQSWRSSRRRGERLARSSKAAATWTSRCVSTPPVIAPCQIGHCHPFVGLGWVTPHQRDDGQDSDGPGSGRLLLGHSVRPVGVEWVTGPGRRIVRKDSPEGTSAGLLESDLAWAPTHTLTNPFTEVVDHSAATSILAAGWDAEASRGFTHC